MGNKGSTEKAVTIVPIISGSISFICSLLLMIRLLRHRSTLLNKVKERLLLGMSLADLTFSLACAASTFAGPSYLLENGDGELYNLFQQYEIHGTRATCNLQGWLYQIGSSTSHYNACLCCYYYLAICCKMRDNQIRVWIEPLMHTIIWLWALISASLTLSLNGTWFMGYQGCFTIDPRQYLRCDIQPDLPDCQEPASSHLVFPLFVVPNVISFSCIFIFVVLVYREVRRTEQRGERWRFNRTVAQQTSSAAATTTRPDSEQKSEVGESIISPSGKAKQEQLQQSETITPVENQQPQEKEYDTISIHSNSVNLQSSLEDGLAPPPRQPASQRLRCCLCNREDSPEHSNAMSTQTSRRRGHPSMTSAATETGIIYVVGYLITFSPGLVQLLLANRNEEPNLPLSLVVGITLPIQGLWNWMFYTRGRLQALRGRGTSDEALERSEIGWMEQLYTIFFK